MSAVDKYAAERMTGCVCTDEQFARRRACDKEWTRCNARIVYLASVGACPLCPKTVKCVHGDAK